MDGAIRPPLAPHRFGGHSGPIGAAEALKILEAGNPPQSWQLLVEAVGVPADDIFEVGREETHSLGRASPDGQDHTRRTEGAMNRERTLVSA